MIELIVSDMDGTLLNGDLVVSQKNQDAIHYTYSQGIPFIVCTGRNFTEAKKVLDDAGIRCPIIGLNGAIQFDRTGSVDYEIALPDSIAQGIIQIGTQKGYYMEAMTSKNVYSCSKPQRMEYIVEIIQHQNPAMNREEAFSRATQSTEVNSIEYRDNLEDLITKEDQKILKITFVHEEGQKVLQALADEFKEKFDDIYTTSSFTYNMEVSHASATKGEALKRYCQAHGYNLDKTIAMGDNYNDLTMLKEVGYSFAMGNAEDEVKRTAKYQTDSNTHDGVAQAIKKALEMEGQDTF